MGPYSKDFIFFATYKRAQKATVFAPSKQCLRVRPEPTKVKPLSGTPHYDKLLPFTTNVRLG